MCELIFVDERLGRRGASYAQGQIPRGDLLPNRSLIVRMHGGGA